MYDWIALTDIKRNIVMRICLLSVRPTHCSGHHKFHALSFQLLKHRISWHLTCGHRPFLNSLDLRVKLFLPRLIQLWNERLPRQSVHCFATKTGAFCRHCTMLTRRVDSSSSSEKKPAINRLSSDKKGIWIRSGWNEVRRVVPAWSHMDLMCQITFCQGNGERKGWVS